MTWFYNRASQYHAQLLYKRYFKRQNASAHLPMAMKQTIRKDMRERRKAIPRTSYAKKSALIKEKLTSMSEFTDADKILVYLSNEEEVDTHELIRDLLKENGRKKVFAPKVNGESLIICPVTSWSDLEKGYFGLLEPCNVANRQHPTQMDIILVPGLAFDMKGHRLGYGKGFYDRLLKLTKGLKIGLAFEEQIVEKLPSMEHDVPLDLIITDATIIHPS